MVFSKKWPKNHPKFLLHFLMHIDVLMLCRKFDMAQCLWYHSFTHNYILDYLQLYTLYVPIVSSFM